MLYVYKKVMKLKLYILGYLIDCVIIYCKCWQFINLRLTILILHLSLVDSWVPSVWENVVIFLPIAELSLLCLEVVHLCWIVYGFLICYLKKSYSNYYLLNFGWLVQSKSADSFCIIIFLKYSQEIYWVIFYPCLYLWNVPSHVVFFILYSNSRF